MKSLEKHAPGIQSNYHQSWAFRTAKHDNSGPAIELISAICKSLCQRVVANSRGGTKMSRRDGLSVGER